MDSCEEGEIESDQEELNPMVSVTKIDPKEIPEVSNKFLMREKDERENNRDDDNRDRRFGWSKRGIPQNSSGKICKGRGSFRFKRDSRSRSRSTTPPHWKQAQNRLIKYTDLEKIQKEKKEEDSRREAEIKRRHEERKRRHEALAQGDGKKSFYQIMQDVPEPKIDDNDESGPVDLNALDYEEDEGDKIEKPKERGFKDKKSNDLEVRNVEIKHHKQRSPMLKEGRVEKNGKNNEIQRKRSRSRSRSNRKDSRSTSHRRSREIDRRDRDRKPYQTSYNRRNDDRRRNDNQRRDERRYSRDRNRKSRSRSGDRQR
jgi:peptidyl-prolyl isomerase G (cyclophilin G)